MSGQVKQQGPSSWVWNKGTSEADTECVEVDVEFDDLGEEPVPDEVPEPVKCPSSTKLRAIELLNEDLNSGTVRVPEDVVIGCDFGHMEAAFSYARLASPEPKHTIPPLDPESALAKCHALIQEQASELGEEMLARVDAEHMAEFWEANWGIVLDLHEEASAECKSLKQQLKTMAEELDEYQAKVAELYKPLLYASDDEIVMVRTYIAKLMGEGRSEHGPLDLATDDRDLLGEGLDELDDVMSYLMMVKRRLELRRKGEV